jgi:hypothetical protein
MTNRWLLVSLAAGMGAAAPAVLWAQQAPRSQFPDPRIYNDELSPRQIQRAQEPETPVRNQRAQQPDPQVGSTAPPRAKQQQQAQPARTVSCSGVFAKDSSHLKLATVYKTDVVFTEVDAGDGKKLMASVLFPTDPKRRLEVWWENEAARMGTHLIVINGKSTWAAPKGLKLGLQLAAIERLNGKPFKLKGFNNDNVGQISDWQGGALAALAGGCKLGVYLRPDGKAPADARSGLSASAEFASNDASVKAVKPTIAEIIIGY